MVLSQHEVPVASPPVLSFLWLEITGQCNLRCQHCYAESGPASTHGRMTPADWQRVLNDAAMMGCRSVQFIGGEPTLHPALPELIRFAAALGLSVEVYSNLVVVKRDLWSTFKGCNVSIATSFYSLHPDVHERITQGRQSWPRTVRNLQLALDLKLPVRVGLIDVQPDQDIEATKAYLRELGVQQIGVDHARSIGRATNLVQVAKPEDALCGACARGKAAITPDGSVYPCVFSRWLPVGNVLQQPLDAILAAAPMAQTRQMLARTFEARRSVARTCNPDVCEPDECDPFCEPYECSPDIPSGCDPTKPLCLPDYKTCNPDTPCSPDTCNPDACNPDKLPE